MLKSVSVKRFKNIVEMNLNLDRINILVGSNNAGKSSSLQAIQFFVSVAQTTSLEAGANRWQDGRLATSLSPTQLVYTPLRDISALAPGGWLREPIEHSIFIALEEEGTNNRTSLTVRKGRNKNIAVELIGAAMGEQIQTIENPYSIYVPGLAGIPMVEEYKNPGIVRRAAARGDANNVFRNVLWLLCSDQGKWDQFMEDFQKVFPRISLNVTFNAERDEHIQATIQNGDTTLPIDAAGTGVLQAIQILSYINVYKPKMLILDEPDAHLHPNNQRKLAYLLSELANNRDIQVILSTHSRHLLDALNNQAKLHWINEGSLIEEDKTNEVGVLMDLGALDRGDLLRSGNIKCVVLTEDLKTAPIEKLLEASNFVMDETDIWSYNGCTKFDSAVMLSNFIQRHAPGTKIIIHRDRDYYLDDEISEYFSKIENAGLFCFITEGTDVESHFINEQHIAFLYDRITVGRVRELVSEVTSEARDDIKSKMISGRSSIEEFIAKTKGERPPSAGELAVRSEHLLDSDIKRFRHGKIVLKRLGNKIQGEIGGNINLIQASPFVKIQRLADYAAELWVTRE